MFINREIVEYIYYVHKMDYLSQKKKVDLYVHIWKDTQNTSFEKIVK